MQPSASAAPASPGVPAAPAAPVGPAAPAPSAAVSPLGLPDRPVGPEDAAAVADLLVERHSQAVSLDASLAAPLRDELRKKCIELYRVYADGLAATFDKLNLLVQREGDTVDAAHALQCVAAPIAAAMYGTGGVGASVQRDLHNAARAKLHMAAQIDARATALKGRPEVLALQRRAERCRQPVFYRPAIVEQQRLALRATSARSLVQNTLVIAANEPRVQLRDGGDGGAIPALNRHFNIKHMHWPCRVAAPPPFGVPGLLWDAVRLQLHPGAWRALGVAPSQARAMSDRALYAIRAPAERPNESTFVLLGGDATPGARAPNGQTTLRVPTFCVRRMVPTLRMADWQLPAAVRRGEATMLGTGGHAKAAHLRYVEPDPEAGPCVLLAAVPSGTDRLHELLAVLGGDPVPLPAPPAGEPDDACLAHLAHSAIQAAARVPRSPAGAPGSGFARLPGGAVIAACALSPSLVIDRLRASERHPHAGSWSADLAAMWLPGAPGLRPMHARVMRYGAARSEPDGPQPIPDDAYDWHDADNDCAPLDDTTGGWAERGAAAWVRALGVAALAADAPPERVLERRVELGEMVLALADPLRWHTARAAATMHEGLRLPPVSCAETPPSSVDAAQQIELANAAVWFRHAGTATERAEHARMCRVYFGQIGRYATVTVDPRGFRVVAKRARPREHGVWRAAKRTCARTLNCDNPDAPARTTSAPDPAASA